METLIICVTAVVTVGLICAASVICKGLQTTYWRREWEKVMDKLDGRK